MKENSETELCPRDDIAAYVDGELSTEAAEAVERHVRACAICSRALLDQRQFLAALSASLDDSKDIVLPSDFARRVVSNAESSVRGVRRPYEFLTAALICAVLLMFLLFAFGVETSAVAAAMGSIAEKLLSIGGFLLRIVGNIAFAAAVVARALGAYTGSSGILIPISIFVFGVFAFISSRWMLRRRSTLMSRGEV